MPYVNDVISSCAFGFAVDTLKDPENSIFRLGKTAIVQDTTQILKLFGYSNLTRLMKVQLSLFRYFFRYPIETA